MLLATYNGFGQTAPQDVDAPVVAAMKETLFWQTQPIPLSNIKTPQQVRDYAAGGHTESKLQAMKASGDQARAWANAALLYSQAYHASDSQTISVADGIGMLRTADSVAYTAKHGTAPQPSAPPAVAKTDSTTDTGAGALTKTDSGTKTGGSNWIWWVIGGAAIIGLGVTGYYLFREPKDESEPEMLPSEV
jgi:hypothetical protein